MTGGCRRAFAAVAACITCCGSPLVAQTTGTLDIGASLVEYEGFLPSAAAVLSSALRHDAVNFSVGAQGSWTVFESGNQILQATAAGAWLYTPREHWRFELAGALGASRYAQEPGSGHALARTRIHAFGQRTGGWIGLTTGGSFGDDARVPVELALAVWRLSEHFAFLGSTAITWLGGNRHLDLLGTARWLRRPLEVEARLGARPTARSDAEVGEAVTGAFGDVSVALEFSDRISIAISGGTYPADPVRRLLSAQYVSAGLRLRLGGANAVPRAAITGVKLGSARNRDSAENTSAARLEIAPAGDLRALRVHVAGARSVELMGDFTDWQAVALTQTAAGTWEIQLPLAAGVHRMNVRLDGGPWLVPAGARPEESDFGGVVGVVFVR